MLAFPRRAGLAHLGGFSWEVSVKSRGPNDDVAAHQVFPSRFPRKVKAMSLIPADVQERVNALLGTGRSAVAALEQQNADFAAIQGGINDMENGRFRPFADFDAEFRERNQIANDA
jgi:predicted transcriptional regulator